MNAGGQAGQAGGGGQGSLANPSTQNGGGGGYTGLGGILQFLAQGGIGAQSYANLGAGATGRGGYAVGSHANGAFSGLSPWAAQWIQQNLLQKNTSPLQSLFGQPTPTTDPSAVDVVANQSPPPGGWTASNGGVPLTGEQLLMAQLHNSLAGLAPATYGLKDGDNVLTPQGLASVFAGMNNQIGGHNVYAHGYDANGRVITGTGGGRDGGRNSGGGHRTRAR